VELTPDNQAQWKGRGAWFCVLALVTCQFFLHLFLRLGARASPGFSQWLGTVPGSAFAVVLQAGLFLPLVFWFSRVPVIPDFIARAGLKQGVNRFGWCAAWLALGLALIDGYGHSRGLTASSEQPHPLKYMSIGAASWFFLKSVLIVPFYEETVTRGFLYRAFRGSYGALASTIATLCFSAYFHWSSMSRSLFTAACLGSLWVLLCIVRERTGSLWGCFLGHAVYNSLAAPPHLWFPAVAVMVLLLPFVWRPSVLSWRAAGQNAEPSASPNDGPATSLGNPEASGGPPSVS
jgi:membrane protease YdiL (CAAX protease family)